VLDWRNRANVTIVIAAAAVAAIVSGTIITGGAIISIVGVPAVVSVVVFIRRPDAQETPYCRVLLRQLIVILLF
jgi:alkylated DNA nucleotide flippase Atl1